MCEVLPCTLPCELSLEMKRHSNMDLEVLRNLRGTEIVLCVPWYRQTMVGVSEKNPYDDEVVSNENVNMVSSVHCFR